MTMVSLMLLHDDDVTSSSIPLSGKKTSPFFYLHFVHILYMQEDCSTAELLALHPPAMSGISIFPQIVHWRVEEVMRMRNEADISALLSVQWGFTIIFEQ